MSLAPGRQKPNGDPISIIDQDSRLSPHEHKDKALYNISNRQEWHAWALLRQIFTLSNLSITLATEYLFYEISKDLIVIDKFSSLVREC